MKTRTLLFFLLSCPVLAFAYSPFPDFDDDARPLLKHQHGLLHYVLSHYEVKPIGYCNHPGNQEHPPLPPFIFKARPINSDGPFTTGLCIFDGEPGHILKVFHIHNSSASPTSGPGPVPTLQVPQNSPSPEQAPTGSPQTLPQDSVPTPSGTSTNTAPTSDTPTGPINN